MTKIVDSAEVFQTLGGLAGWAPAFNVAPKRTATGTSYFTKPGVVMLARPTFNVEAMRKFLEGFDDELGFEGYTEDDPLDIGYEDRLTNAGASLAKVAGQLCYMSFGPKRSRNIDAQKYVDNIMSSGHGSVLEHPKYSFLIYGADRSFTHELVRHRTGVAFSQQSQRYVDGKTLRFVERPEWQDDGKLHVKFLDRIDRAAREYDQLAGDLLARQASGDVALSGEKKTELRKKVNQAARSCLPNEVEAPIVFSGNVRALRHVCEMRAAGAADVPIREVTTRIFLCMQAIEPILFNDYKLLQAPDGTYAVSTEWRKV